MGDTGSLFMGFLLAAVGIKLRFPENFFYIRGNHDGFSDDIAKDGIPQGLLWKRALKEARGKRYRKAMARYYELLPYVVASTRFAAVHAAPPRTKISADMLVNIQAHGYNPLRITPQVRHR